MSEKYIENFSNLAQSKLTHHIIEDLGHNIGQGNDNEKLSRAKESIDKYLAGTNVELVPTNTPEELLEIRKKLNTEGGLLIGNHPGYFDAPGLIKALDRNDFKIITGTQNFEILNKLINSDHLVPANTTLTELKKNLHNLLFFIKQGGLVVLFPSGGNENQTGKEFKNGFRYLVERLDPKAMIYCFHTDSEDVKKAITQLHRRLASVAAKDLISPSLPPLVKKVQVKTTERYTQAEEWQRLVNKDKNVSNKQMTEHFFELFKS